MPPFSIPTSSESFEQCTPEKLPTWWKSVLWETQIHQDPRDPRSLGLGPCQKDHLATTWKCNQSGVWLHCNVCGLRLCYCSRSGAPANSVSKHLAIPEHVQEALDLYRADFPAFDKYHLTEPRMRGYIKIVQGKYQADPKDKAPKNQTEKPKKKPSKKSKETPEPEEIPHSNSASSGTISLPEKWLNLIEKLLIRTEARKKIRQRLDADGIMAEFADVGDIL